MAPVLPQMPLSLELMLSLLEPLLLLLLLLLLLRSELPLLASEPELPMLAKSSSMSMKLDPGLRLERLSNESSDVSNRLPKKSPNKLGGYKLSLVLLLRRLLLLELPLVLLLLMLELLLLTEKPSLDSTKPTVLEEPPPKPVIV
jgi:hypothetical protein